VLSWAGDGQQIAFVELGQSGPPGTVRLLQANDPGGDLQADSRVVLAPATWLAALITPDGQTIVAAEQPPIYHPGLQGAREELAEFSAATGRMTAVLNDLAVIGAPEQVLWTNSSGSVLVVAGVRAGTGAGILRGGGYTPIPWTPQTVAAAW
jgi:hypothetical protein